MLRGSRSFFTSSIDEDIIDRYRQLDISSCGSLYGSGEYPLMAEAKAIEEDVFQKNPEIISTLEKNDVRLQMRSLRVAVDELLYEYDEQRRQFTISCRLPAGSYLTTLLDHVFVTA